MNSSVETKGKRNHSDYWLGGSDDSPILTGNMNESQLDSHKMFKLSSSKRAISNFVQIVTNQRIPVTFNTKGDSYTDGKQVVIGANIIKPDDFDVAVGLALHEASHIKLSDFNLLKSIDTLIPKTVTETAIKLGILNSTSLIKNLWNYVEDRRIDSYIFGQAPGYRAYYLSMYSKYFNSPQIDKGLLSDEYRTETVDSYFFRIINLHNPNSPLDALLGLKDIHTLINFNDILRLKSSQETFAVALGIFKIMLKTLAVQQKSKEDEAKDNGKGEPGNGEGGEGEGDGNESLSDEQFEDLLKSVEEMNLSDGDSKSGGSSVPVDSDGKGGGDGSKPKNDIKLTPKQAELLKKAIEKQKDFLEGKTKKDELSTDEGKRLAQIDETGSELKTAGNDVEREYGEGNQKPVQVVTVGKLTHNLLESADFPMTHNSYGGVSKPYDSEVAKGIQIGFILGKKLQVRGEDRTTIFNRQKVGKIDKRMIASLGYGNENVFQFNDVDSYKKANIHISIDASGSMGGSKWRQTMVNVVAMCKAVDMIANLQIQVTFRTTVGGTSGSSPLLPYVVMAYDSRVDKLTKVKSMFPSLEPGGVTPEGLCFEAILKEFIPSNNGTDSYFLNISDGEPWFSNRAGMDYEGTAAFNHTKKMVGKILGMGIKVLSYYVDSSSYSGVSDGFKRMYGKSAVKINVENVSEITKTINKLFLTK